MRLGHRLESLGRNLTLVANAGLGVSGVAEAGFPRFLVDPLPLPAAVQVTSCAVLAVGAMAGLLRQSNWLPFALISCIWFCLVLASARLFTQTPGLVLLVGPIQCLVLSLAAASLLPVRQLLPAARALSIVSGVALALFGAVHLSHTDAVATLAPSWIPGRATLPVFTGTLLISLGVATLLPRTRAWANILAATLFFSWLILIHAPRLARDPGSTFEWQFALVALGLCGALLLVAGGSVIEPRSID